MTLTCCPECDIDYKADFTHCPRCGTALVPRTLSFEETVQMCRGSKFYAFVYRFASLLRSGFDRIMALWKTLRGMSLERIAIYTSLVVIFVSLAVIAWRYGVLPSIVSAAWDISLRILSGALDILLGIL